MRKRYPGKNAIAPVFAWLRMTVGVEKVEKGFLRPLSTAADLVSHCLCCCRLISDKGPFQKFAPGGEGVRR